MGGDELVGVFGPFEGTHLGPKKDEHRHQLKKTVVAYLRAGVDFVQEVSVDSVPEADPFIGRATT